MIQVFEGSQLVQGPARAAPSGTKVDHHRHPLVEVGLECVRLSIDVGHSKVGRSGAIGKLCPTGRECGHHDHQGEKIFHCCDVMLCARKKGDTSGKRLKIVKCVAMDNQVAQIPPVIQYEMQEKGRSWDSKSALVAEANSQLLLCNAHGLHTIACTKHHVVHACLEAAQVHRSAVFAGGQSSELDELNFLTDGVCNGNGHITGLAK